MTYEETNIKYSALRIYIKNQVFQTFETKSNLQILVTDEIRQNSKFNHLLKISKISHVVMSIESSS